MVHPVENNTLIIIIIIIVVIIIIIVMVIIVAIINGNRTEWSTIQGVIGRVISNLDLKLRAQLPLNCTTQSPITNCSNNKM